MTQHSGPTPGGGRGDIRPSSRPRWPRTWRSERPPAGGPAYQVAARSWCSPSASRRVVLAYGYGLGSLRRPGPGLWPFVVSLADRRAVGRAPGRRSHLADARAVHAARACSSPAARDLRRVRLPAPGHRLRDPRHPARHRLAALPRRGVVAHHDRHRRSSHRAAFYLLFLYALDIPLPHLSPSEPGREHDGHAFLDGFAVVTQTDQPALLPDRRRSSACSSACCPASARPPRWRSCCRSTYSASTRSRRSSCSPASTTAPSTAAPSPRCCCACPARHLGGHRVRRLRPGQAGQGRHRARHRRDRLVHRRDRLDHRPDACWARSSRASRSTSARRSTPRWRCSACCSSPPSATATPSRPSIAAASACCWPPSAATASPAPTGSPSTACNSPTASTSSSSRWACSGSARSSTTSRSATASRTCRPPSPTSGPPARTSSRPAPPSAAARSSASSSACCPAAAP